jgi:hypothetical protein
MDQLAELSWLPSSRSESLHAVYVRALQRAEEAATWYVSRRAAKRRWAMYLRVGAIALASIAAILPLLSQVFQDEGKPVIQPVWASVALVLAAALVGLDRYFGFSSAWMRFMISELSLNALISDFELAWQAERASWADGAPSSQQVEDALSIVRKFVATVTGVVRDETSSWVTEFQAALKELDQSTRGRTGEK